VTLFPFFPVGVVGFGSILHRGGGLLRFAVCYFLNLDMSRFTSCVDSRENFGNVFLHKFKNLKGHFFNIYTRNGTSI
jgi:hypothetical protein